MEIESLLGTTPRDRPDAMALDDGTRQISYGQLPGVVTQEAAFLRASQGLRFGLLAENGCGWIVADLALHHLQRLNLPLPAYFTPRQLRHAIDDAGVDCVLTDSPARVRELSPEFAEAGVSPVSGLTLFRRPLDSTRRPRLAEGVAKVTYTSGSTAEPKGVCLTTANLNCVSRALADVIRPLGLRRHLCLMPLATLLENMAGVHAALRAGAGCLAPPADITGMSYGSLDPGKVLAIIGRLQPDSLVLVPELLRLLVRAAQAGYALPTSLRFIAVGGAPVSGSLLSEAADLKLPVFEGYGLSEAASVVCLNTPLASRRGSVGKPLPHLRVRIDGQGQICVRGSVMSGYVGGPDMDWATEIQTGDLGEIDADGYVYVRGRIKNLIITSLGRNVSPEWVERELTHEGAIRHAVALGDGAPHLCALLSPASPDLDSAALEAAVQRANARLPDYARIHHWQRMPEAPSLSNGLLTANGRPRRVQILERYGTLLQMAS